MIGDHVWRPPHGAARPAAQGPVADRPCEFMNCRRPRAEHLRTTRLRDGRAR